MDTTQEHYSKIIESGNSEQLLAFLKSLDDKQRKNLVPLIKKDVKRLGEYQWHEVSIGGFRGRTYQQDGTKNQLEMLSVAIISCYARKDCKNIERNLLSSNEAVKQTLKWHCPEWLTDYINGDIKGGDFSIDYATLCDWIAEKYVGNITPQVIVNKITSASTLENHRFSLDDHIWMVFNYPCSVSWSDQWYPKESKPEDAGERKWIYFFKKYITEKRINRIKVLKESLLAVNRNFNREQTCWYATLFSSLQPTADECLQLQEALFSTYYCPHSKPITTALQAIKKISEHPQFHHDEFISCLPQLFSFTTKGIVDSALTIADKLAKLHPDKKFEICQHLTTVFLSKDVGLQNKAAKLIAKYASPLEPEISSLLSRYGDNLLTGARDLLTDFLDVTPLTSDKSAELSPVFPLIREDNRIAEIETWDDFVFLAGQAFHNVESYHFDLLPAALLRFAPEINEENVNQLEPAFMQALEASEHISFFEGMLGFFFMEYAAELISRFPLQTAKIKIMYEDFKSLKNTTDKWKKIDWGFHSYDTENKKRNRSWIVFFKNILLLLTNQANLPLLSTPTHLPCFIDPAVFVQRLLQYQNAGVEPCSQDMQLAIQRCVFIGNQPDISQLNPGYAALVRYLLSGEQDALAHVAHDEWKLAAIITRSAVNADTTSFDVGYALLEKHALPMALLSNMFPWFIKENKAHLPVRTFNFDVTTAVQNLEMTLFYADSFMPCDKYSYFGGEYKRRTLYAFPWQGDVTLMRYIEMNFHDPNISSTKSNLEILQALYDLPLPLSPVGHLLTALCMLHSDKTVRALAGELWIEKLRYPQGINSAHIGDILGQLEKESWAPLKRFTDLAMQSLINISFRHNQALLEMVSAMDSHLSTVKITNYKKLNELQHELTRKS
ncbi:DUF6493 family protein [Escherichia marmotae]|uniref:DUF6493 family protein n=1 Tax=Escherichia TaxID=561 RepID=UPI000CF79E80|nr:MULTISPECIES: DUF6493 family protein [Escherichia]EFO1628812.1 hypothetical protein [Escherichia coli]MBB2423047.1 hypothetical protein [Escherichia sp. 11.1597]MDQ9239171.1 hypothetical protein [Escherichia marmotae]MDQ9268835.1 hypothetical protein [Escherichia marmotae]MDQ9312582.1 hypothetical protein [Escherichia marmotae]